MAAGPAGRAGPDVDPPAAPWYTTIERPARMAIRDAVGSWSVVLTLFAASGVLSPVAADTCSLDTPAAEAPADQVAAAPGSAVPEPDDDPAPRPADPADPPAWLLGEHAGVPDLEDPALSRSGPACADLPPNTGGCREDVIEAAFMVPERAGPPPPRGVSGAGPPPPPAADSRDPWAEAFAESARLGGLSSPFPPYPVIVNDQVEAFIARFTGQRRDVINLWLGRARQYWGMVRDVLRNQGLPEELAFVAMIESGYNPLAVSRAGAKGMWQFMADTARRYGLRVDHWVDERFDPEKSTVAAAAYLNDLYRQFGSWALAKAAYNAGEMKVVRAIRAVGSSDFWALARSRFLRQETKEFVPAIHAVTVIGRDPERYGLEPEPVQPPAVEAVTVPAATSLRWLSSSADIPVETLRTLNPVLIRGVTPPGAPFEIRVPAGRARQVLAALSTPAGRRRAVAVSGGGPIHMVRAGETVTTIARRHGVPVSAVLDANGLEERDLIRPGDRLRIPVPARVAEGSRASRVR